MDCFYQTDDKDQNENFEPSSSDFFRNKRILGSFMCMPRNDFDPDNQN